METDATAVPSILEELQGACSHVLGYTQPLTMKPMEPTPKPQKRRSNNVGTQAEERALSHRESMAFPLHLHIFSKEQRGKGAIERERRAIKWARYGLTHVCHVVDPSATRPEPRVDRSTVKVDRWSTGGRQSTAGRQCHCQPLSTTVNHCQPQSHA